MQLLMSEKGYCFFAADELSSSNLMGFIGIADIPYEASFTPGVEIGWRLGQQYWGKGYATEGAKMCLNYAKDVLHIEAVYSIAPIVNTRSIHVMEKIGMTRKLEFDHPLLGDYPLLERCVCYEV